MMDQRGDIQRFIRNKRGGEELRQPCGRVPNGADRTVRSFKKIEEPGRVVATLEVEDRVAKI